MTVPALTTADIATFAYWRQTSCTYVQLADVLPILHSYRQLGEYVDGTIKIFDTGSESVSPNNYVLINVRIRADGWIMAWFPRTLMTGTAVSGSGVTVNATGMQIQRNGETSAGAVQTDELAGYIFKPTSGDLSGNEYCIKSSTTTTITLYDKYGDNVSTNMATLGTATYDILQSRGNLVWWGHTSSISGDPTSQSTRLGRALHEMWEALKANQQGGSGAALGYADVGYWDYEYTSAAHLYIFGHNKSLTGSNTDDKYFYCTIPNGVTLYSGVLNYGTYVRSAAQASARARCRGYVNTVAKYITDSTGAAGSQTISNDGFTNVDITTGMQVYGVQHTIRSYTYVVSSSTAHNNTAVILLTSG